jgi:PAS domain S-box-containing protein
LIRKRYPLYNRAMASLTRQRPQEKLQKALDELKNSESKLRQVIDTIPALAWCMLPDGSIEFLNRRWHEYTGLSPEESYGSGWQVAIHPEDRAPLVEQCKEQLTSGEPGETEARLRRHDGVFRWFLMRVEALRDETGKIVRWYGTCTDIETLKETEAKLREDERELRRITDLIPQAIVVQDPSGAPIYANQATLDYTGLTAEDVIAPLFRERIFHADDLERLRQERNTALGRGAPFEIEQRARGKDGQYRWFLVRYNPFRNDQGQVTRWYATGTDIDDRVRAEERTRNENLALREQIDRDSMFEDIVGSSDALRKVFGQIAKLASSDSTVLILGETGTGKELIARSIHKRSNRADRAFIGVNLHAPRLGGHQVLWFNPALLELNKEIADGIANKEILQGDPGPGLVLYNAWKSRRATILQNGTKPSFQIVVATDAASGQGVKIPVEIISIALGGSRTRGRRFGSLVHSIIMDADFDSDPVALQRLAVAHASRLSASEDEIESAVGVVASILEHAILKAAAGAAVAHREYPFLFRDEHGAIVEGNIDLVYQQNAEWIIVDFKTGPADRKEYRRQVELYGKALQPRSVRAILFEIT